MVTVESTVPVLLVILVLALIVPDLLKKLHLPFVTSLILIGAIFGPFGLNYIQFNDIIAFFGFLGSAFLMLMAGLEAKIARLQKLGKKIIILAITNSTIPFLAGLGIARFFGYPWMTSLLLGVIFMSSSVAIIATMIKNSKIANTEIGESIMAATLLEDFASLFLLAIVLQNVAPITQFPLPIYFIILIASIIALKMFLPEFTKYYFQHRLKGQDRYEGQLRFILVILLAVLFYFSGLGVHPIVAAFLVGFLLSDVLTSEKIYQKLHTLSYGLFIPIFFFVIGMDLNLHMLLSFNYGDILMITIVGGLILTKWLSGYIAGRLVNFSKINANLFGIASTTQLTTTLAATYAAASLGILDTALTTSIIVLAIATTILAPILFNTFTQKRTSS